MNASLLLRASISLLLFGSLVSTAVQPTVAAIPLIQHTKAEPIKDPFLLKVRKTGGMCRLNSCDRELTILRDGTYRYADATKTGTGRLSRKTFTRLKQRLSRLNLEQVRSKPFTGTCPIAYDGPETLYRFLIGNTVEEVSDCKVAIDPRDPLFQQLNQIYDRVTETVYQSESR